MPIKVTILLIEVFLEEISDFHEKEIISLVAALQLLQNARLICSFNVLCTTIPYLYFDVSFSLTL